MSFITCILTVITVDWNLNEIRSSPMIVPCIGMDHILRLEMVTIPTRSEYFEFRRVLQMSAARTSKEIPAENFGNSVSVIGPRILGQHYAGMLQENRSFLSQNKTVRLVSVTEKVDYNQYSQVNHLVQRLKHASPNVEDKSPLKQMDHPSQRTQKESTNKREFVTPEDLILFAESKIDSEASHEPITAIGAFAGAQYRPRTRLLSRKRRMGTLNVDNKITTEIQTENTRQNEKHGSDNQESKRTGGGYGSQTCINSQFTAWNNSTFTSGTCGCECPTCPSCNTATIISMAEKATAERMSVQSKLTECQGKLLTQQGCPSLTTSPSVPMSCNTGELQRLKEETRTLRARMRRMTSTRTEVAPAPTKSTLVSTLETAGGLLVEGMVGYSTSRSSSRSGSNENYKPTSPRTMNGSTGANTVPKTTSKSSSTSSRRKKPSRIPVSRGSRVTSRKNSRSGSRIQSVSKVQRGRRSLDVLQQSLSRYNPWSPHSEELRQRHFVAAESSKSVHVGNNLFITMEPVKKYSSRDQSDYDHLNPKIAKARSRRDTHDSHFTGSQNSADVTAFDHANFKGSSEVRNDNSTNVRDFRPNLSPEINIDSRGKNESLVNQPHNENDIKIVNSPPCICDDNFNMIMSAVWTQMCLTVVLTISVIVHYHIHRCFSHKKKKDLDLLKMQAHMVYQQNKTSRRLNVPKRKFTDKSMSPDIKDSRCNQLEFY